MPSLSRITATFFVGLITRLGVRPPPPEGFQISNVVQPVSLVDADVSIPVVSSVPMIDSPFTAGEVADGANVVYADTGAIAAAGTYTFTILVGANSAAADIPSPDFRIQRRDAANAVSVWSQYFSIAARTAVPWKLVIRTNVLAGERIRVISASAGALSVVQVSIWQSS